MDYITSDIVIEICGCGKYSSNEENRQKGKDVRQFLEGLNWKFVGEIPKTVHGHKTTVALYCRDTTV
ncbi:MAG: hypothetical protein ACOX8S_11635 [Christensenellales bacterium]|jgi:hypothetical protein